MLRRLAAAALVGVVAGGASGQSLPRVAVEDGQFVQVDGASTTPLSGGGFRGANYIRLFPDRAWHATFAPDYYDGQRADDALAEMAKHGMNAVRVFIDHESPQGVVADPATNQLSTQYLDNFADFLSRAQSHGVYVIPSLVYLAATSSNLQVLYTPEPGLQAENIFYLDPGAIAAKAQYAAEFVQEIKNRDPGLLSTVLAYELENEANMLDNASPFSLTSGLVTNTASGQVYNMALPADKQRMADDNAVVWANASVAAIKDVDPDALVSVNVFTYQAVGRTGPGFTSGSSFGDHRFPARPLALLDSNIDYLDVHFYPFNDSTLTGDLASIEYPAVVTKAQAQCTPLVTGEFGAFKSTYPTLAVAARKMRQHLETLDSKGFTSQMIWTYDTDEQDFLWNARSGRGELFQAMIATYRKLDRSTAPVTSEDFHVRAGTTSLNDQESDYGGVAWLADASLSLHDVNGDGILERSGLGTGVALVPYNPSDNGEIIRLHAIVASPAGTPDWVGVGLTDQLSTGSVFWNDGSLWALLRGNGGVEVHVDGVSQTLLSTTTPTSDFVANGFNDLDLIYDTTANLVWVLVNGQPVLDAYDLGAAVIPVIGAGLHLFANNSVVSDFDLRLLPLFTTLAGDFNGDRRVDVQDINPFIMALQDSDAYLAAYPGLEARYLDLNGDGLINVQDINPFVAALTAAGMSVDGLIIPEPASGMMLLAALGGLGRMARRRANRV
ncbi:MAG: cellulase family glycosylhydrolase [Phycisphaeraceae bacterium]|nr:cellulase family glycosylhydrolase [Phycisphaeraceae bacterium]